MNQKLNFWIKEKVILKMKIKSVLKSNIIGIILIILLSIGIYFTFIGIKNNIYRIIDNRIELHNKK